MFEQMILPDMGNAISSQESGAGLSPYASRASPVRQESGPEAHPFKTTASPQPSTGAHWTLRNTKRTGPHTWLDLIAARQPQGICFENVLGISPWLAEITSRLGQLGYRVRRPERSSADVGALHLRRRVWIVADRGGQGLPKPGDPNHPRRSATRGQPLPETFSSPVPAELARWMMGFPPDCVQCMPMETP